jgi:hypothetical protein
MTLPLLDLGTLAARHIACPAVRPEVPAAPRFTQPGLTTQTPMLRIRPSRGSGQAHALVVGLTGLGNRLDEYERCLTRSPADRLATRPGLWVKYSDADIQSGPRPGLFVAQQVSDVADKRPGIPV